MGTSKVFTDRSRIETFQRCNRLRWLEYHQDGMGITSARKPLPLAVGGAVHVGLAELLKMGVAGPDPHHGQAVEDRAVVVALADFAQFQNALDVDQAEQYAIEGGEVSDPTLAARMLELVKKGKTEFDSYLYEEQSALVEGMVRAYARRRLRPLLEQYEVMEVEREGSWLLSGVDAITAQDGNATRVVRDGFELYFMSRPDAILRERASNQLYILSYKTAAKWDRRKAEDAKRDMQGLSEGVEVEKRLARMWSAMYGQKGMMSLEEFKTHSPAMVKFLDSCAAPPRILGIRYEYLLKGDRWTDKDLTAKLGVEVRSQRSPLVRANRNPGMAAGDEQWNVSWDFIKETGEPGKLYYKNWSGAPVFKSMPMKKWIDMLDGASETVGEEGLALGWSCAAQATGFLSGHPLDELFIPPIVVYRQDDDLRDWVEQVESQEVRVARSVAEVNAATDEGEKRHLLNVHFPMSRRACEYPSTCAMVRVCFGGEDIRRDPLASGLYKIRIANHPQESASE